jgi:hypothetical protein
MSPHVHVPRLSHSSDSCRVHRNVSYTNTVYYGVGRCPSPFPLLCRRRAVKASASTDAISKPVRHPHESWRSWNRRQSARATNRAGLVTGAKKTILVFFSRPTVTDPNLGLRGQFLACPIAGINPSDCDKSVGRLCSYGAVV